jgi:hypothetical protein
LPNNSRIKYFLPKNTLYIKLTNYSWNIRLWVKNELFTNNLRVLLLWYVVRTDPIIYVWCIEIAYDLTLKGPLILTSPVRSSSYGCYHFKERSPWKTKLIDPICLLESYDSNCHRRVLRSCFDCSRYRLLYIIL